MMAKAVSQAPLAFSLGGTGTPTCTPSMRRGRAGRRPFGRRDPRSPRFVVLAEQSTEERGADGRSRDRPGILAGLALPLLVEPRHDSHPPAALELERVELQPEAGRATNLL